MRRATTRFPIAPNRSRTTSFGLMWSCALQLTTHRLILLHTFVAASVCFLHFSCCFFSFSLHMSSGESITHSSDCVFSNAKPMFRLPTHSSPSSSFSLIIIFLFSVSITVRAGHTCAVVRRRTANTRLNLLVAVNVLAQQTQTLMNIFSRRKRTRAEERTATAVVHIQLQSARPIWNGVCDCCVFLAVIFFAMAIPVSRTLMPFRGERAFEVAHSHTHFVHLCTRNALLNSQQRWIYGQRRKFLRKIRKFFMIYSH